MKEKFFTMKNAKKKTKTKRSNDEKNGEIKTLWKKIFRMKDSNDEKLKQISRTGRIVVSME